MPNDIVSAIFLAGMVGLLAGAGGGKGVSPGPDYAVFLAWVRARLAERGEERGCL